MFFVTNEREAKGATPTDDELQVEACRIIFGAEVLSKKAASSQPSWLRDLLLSSDELSLRARLAPIRAQKDSRQSLLKINGKDGIFDQDPLELQLHEYVTARRLLGLTAIDHELQAEACNIIGRMEESSDRPSDEIANFILRLVLASPKFLADFRQRAMLPRSEDMNDEAIRSKDPNSIDSTIHNYSRLETELAGYVHTQRAVGVEPSDADLQKQARIIIYEYDDGWNQTAADNAAWLSAFRQRHSSSESSAATLARKEPLTITSAMGTTQIMPSKNVGCLPCQPGSGGNPMKLGPFFFNDANCYRRLARELGRWVQSTMSPNNPNSHVPSDKEIQHQARWILYDEYVSTPTSWDSFHKLTSIHSDDPWNQTAADNAEWLRRFKRDAGILTDPSLPGLPEGNQWCLTQGGSGFAPPYAFPNPKAPVAPFAEDHVPIPMCEDRFIPAESTTASKYIRGLAARPQIATVFCSRELESNLVEFVEQEIADTGVFPTDDALRAKARVILNMTNTAADDAVLLEKFKRMMKARLGVMESPNQLSPDGSLGFSGLSSTPSTHSSGLDLLMPLGMDFSVSPGMDLGLGDFEMNDVLQDIDFDFTDLAGSAGLTFDMTLG